MKTVKTARADRLDRALRWTLGLTLIAAVAWAWAQGSGAGL
ncbi:MULTISPECIES: hypothetical protein [unclassified Lysobacter]|nr:MULTISPECIES: hypothetical protein [unclassified Lysobacter]